MSKKLYEEDSIRAIADAIREKNGEEASYKVSQMAQAILDIDGGEAVIQPLSVAQNGTYNPPSGVDGYSPVVVNVSGGGQPDTEIDAFANPVVLFHSYRASITDQSRSGNAVDLTLSIAGDTGYEGFNIQLSNLVADSAYKLIFDLQMDDGFLSGYTTGFKVTDNTETDYVNYTRWPNNLIKDASEHSYISKFVPSGNTAYLSFNLSGLSNTTHSLTIKNMVVATVNVSGGSVSGGPVHIWTQSTGDTSAALNIQNVIYDPSTGTYSPDGDTVLVGCLDCRFTDGAHDCNNIAYLTYGSPDMYWTIVASVDVTNGANIYRKGSMTNSWRYNSQVDIYLRPANS